MAHFEHHFTLDEANALIPWIRNLFAQVQRILEDLAGPASANPLAAELLAPHADLEPKPGQGNGHGRERLPGEALDLDSVWTELSREDKMKLVNGLVQSLIDRGIVIQDVQRGLVDFPALRDDDEILLCYELSDGDRIGWWHELHGGYAGRRPLSELF